MTGIVPVVQPTQFNIVTVATHKDDQIEGLEVVTETLRRIPPEMRYP